MRGEPPIKPEDAPDSIYGPDGKPRFFAEPGMDRFVAVVMNLAQEVWVQEERLMALEGEKADPEARDAKLKAFIDRVFDPIRESDA
ncbi:hypothetical protein HFP57_14210 [Parasphingopyxis algicola]|uniref:hypothetical protein n=1 Tax=Parasphingopyxis algicola TaxID=2026624 RepID=UPI0015A14A00|nr:hypothetical protein [Parasphingopyxis algicola]QLC26061.1 hypothetical protein HFP57_14210 [Parasphingopyxis algicola]